MSKTDVIEVKGSVLEVLPDSKYRVQLDTGHGVLGYLSGRMKQNHISVTVGDKVLLELTPYDLTKGRIVRRLAFEKDS
ncbi:MAG: translation initiation factor IF-1 [Candidatus Berkelbacteria bacterium]